MIPENRHIIDVRMNKNDLEILIRGSEEIIPEDSFLEKIKGKKKLRIKAGFDPTSPDLHLGQRVDRSLFWQPHRHHGQVNGHH